MLTPTVRRTFSPRGKTPLLPCWDRHDRISAISAITLSPKQRRPGLYFLLLPDNQNVHAEEVVRFLQLLKRHLPRPLTILWDRYNIHDRSRVVREYLSRHREIATERFPSYAPELNPDEGVWDHTKYTGLANFVPQDIKQLRRRITAHLRHLRRRPDLLLSFIHHSELPLGV